MKIYTKKGDDGTTSLWYGGRVEKNGLRTEFSRAKLRASLELALRKRPVSIESVDAAVTDIEERLLAAGASLLLDSGRENLNQVLSVQRLSRRAGRSGPG
mgnify:CR=1 FL=1